MKTFGKFLAVVASAALATPAPAQDQPPRPGPEHEVLKKHEGTWDFVMKFGGMEAKGTQTARMELGGLWLVTNMETELFGQKFSGKGLDTYDPASKLYASIWVDSMGTKPVMLEGSYDKATKTMTMTGTGPGMDGKETKYKSVSVMPDDDTINFTMYIGDTTEPTFTVIYKRKK
jgi:hypothetical protein